MMHRKKILIVEPSSIDRRDLKETIEAHETLVEVIAVPDAEQARDILRKHQPDVAFVQVDLPQEEGPELIQTIRQTAPESRIVALAGIAPEALKTAALEKGANDVFLKEMSIGFRLIDLIHDVIRR